jgi:hypothetical protein
MTMRMIMVGLLTTDRAVNRPTGNALTIMIEIT